MMKLPMMINKVTIPLTHEGHADFIEFTIGISRESPVASGSFGDVYKCTVGETEVAVKVFRIIPAQRTLEKLQKTALREFKVWIGLKHPNITPLLGTAQAESPLLALVSQWMPSGTLLQYLDGQATTITLSARIELVKGIAKGLDYLHSENVIHGDLHPNNVLIDGSGNPCLTDFGLATVAGNEELQLSATTAGRPFNPQWRAPEVVGVYLDQSPVRPNFKSDIYSFGSVMFFIVSGDAPWKGMSHAQIVTVLANKTIPARPRGIFDYHWEFIQKCWFLEPRDRPEAAGVLLFINSCASCMSAKNIVLFGESRAGKNSVVNLMAEQEKAQAAPATKRCTLHLRERFITFDENCYQVFDTVGLEAPQLGVQEYLDAIVNTYNLITQLGKTGGIDLLLMCVRADSTVTATTQSNYRLFYEWLGEKKIPIVLVATGLEKEDTMENWWMRNKPIFDQYDIHVAGHACITTAANTLDERHLYDESRRLVRDLVTNGTQGDTLAYTGGEAWYSRVMQKLWELTDGSKLSPKRKDIETVLTKHYRIPPEDLKELAQKIKSDLKVKSS